MGGGRAMGGGERERERERGVESGDLKERLGQPRGLSWCHRQVARETYGPGGGAAAGLA